MIDVCFGDCMELMKQYPDGYFDLAVVDIEYGIGASNPSVKNSHVMQKNGNKLPVKNNKYQKKDWDYVKRDDAYFDLLFAKSKKQIIFGGNYYGLSGGYIVWDKLNGENDQFGCELAWTSFQNRTDIVYYLWQGMIQGVYCGVDIKKALIQQGNKKLNQQRIHETEKPIKLYDYLYQKYLPNGGIVLDTHGGSMSNAIAWINAGNIEGVIVEIDIDHYTNASNRIKQVHSQLSLFNSIEINYRDV